MREAHLRCLRNIEGLPVSLLLRDSTEGLSRCVVDYGLESFDLIYVDGDHEAHRALSDIAVSFHLLKPSGWLLIDDLHLHACRRRTNGTPKVFEAVTSWESCVGDMAELVWESSHQAMYRKRSRDELHGIALAKRKAPPIQEALRV